MDFAAAREQARERLTGVCRVCPVCDGQRCIGRMPGMGGKGTGASFKNNTAALNRILLNMRLIHDAAAPDLTYDLFGRKLACPILGAPMCETTHNFLGRVDDREFIDAQVRGAAAAGTLAMTGDSPQELLFEMGLQVIRSAGGLGIPVIKPRETEEIIKRIRQAEAAGALAVGIDIDAAAFPNLPRAGQPVGPKTTAQLREIVRSTALPLILKGIMTADDAIRAEEAGAAGIVVSNHGGRALDYTPGTAAVLPEIAAALQGRIRVLMDGGVRSGEDVLKALALGAEAVLVGRPVAIAAVGGREAGVRSLLEQMAGELKAAMVLTGCRSLAEAGPHVIRSM